MTIHSSGQTVFCFSHIEIITLGAGEEVDAVTGGASGMGVDRIGEVGNTASEVQATSWCGMFYSGVSGRSSRLVLMRS